jgi:hypothetical protein
VALSITLDCSCSSPTRTHILGSQPSDRHGLKLKHQLYPNHHSPLTTSCSSRASLPACRLPATSQVRDSFHGHGAPMCCHSQTSSLSHLHCAQTAAHAGESGADSSSQAGLAKRRMQVRCQGTSIMHPFLHMHPFVIFGMFVYTCVRTSDSAVTSKLPCLASQAKMNA